MTNAARRAEPLADDRPERDPLALQIVELTNEEFDRMFEEGVWEEFQMTGEEFLRRYDSGELSDPGHPKWSRAAALHIMRPVD